MKNFLPFARLAEVTLTTKDLNRSGRPIPRSTRLADLSTGGFVRAHLQDAYPFFPEGLSSVVSSAGWPAIRMRMGVYGRNYLTEDLYEVQAYCDKHMPSFACWDWEKPYRIYPGQKLRVTIGTSRSQVGGFGDLWPVGGVMFNAVKVNNGEPIMLYAIAEEPPDTVDEAGFQYNLMLADVQIECPHDSPVDIYSVSLNEVDVLTPFNPRRVHIRDANDRPFWPNSATRGVIQPPMSGIILGPEWILTPDETITFEFETDVDNGVSEDITIQVLVRGCMEVEDGR